MRRSSIILINLKLLVLYLYHIMNNLGNILRTRLARNVYFWIIVVLFMLGLNNYVTAYDRSVYLMFKGLTTLLLFLLTIANNFVVIPRTLAKKRYGLYTLVTFLLLTLFSFLYVLLMKVMYLHYPDIKVYEVSFVTSPVTDVWTVSEFVTDMLTYAFGLFMWVGVFTMAWYMNAYWIQEKRTREAKQKQLETELRLLRNQLNPHFLFNTLNNIYGLTLKKSDLAPESVLQLSSIMRYVLYDANTATMPYEKEKEIMQAYIDMELLRLQQKEKVTYSIEADDNYRIPPLLWLAVLENAFKYATRVIADSYFIDYHFSIENNVLQIRSANSYKEGADKNLNSGGLGLSNLRKRLDILYPEKYQLTETKEQGVYSINVIIPLA